MDRKEIVVFDFDRTLTTYDTTLDFFQFCGRRKALFVFRYYWYLFLWCLQKLDLISNLQLKNLGIKLFIKSHKAEDVKQLAKEFSSKIKLNQIYHYNFKTECANARVIVVSAAFEIYLEHLFPNIEIIGTSLRKEEEEFVQIEEHVYGERKGLKLQQMGIQEIDRLYTDSRNDSSLLAMSAQCNLVVNNEINTIVSNLSFEDVSHEIFKAQKKDFRSILFCRYQNLELK
ncbi:HAD family hydrolase [Marinifilum caeruleilacunae]|uniref:Haloacid dehalogenase-like hydrolase n=1 Tax=Marinifilum caeruleilacunae TaxID=2499076 RepID=A0ABX1WQP3_9BACT|nr:HAD family hydrolase [Marinifilum caeruleilacunae]NOU58409.1 haloacid dehalogenase-like hydrolase [Marinifilum caeruleilacunae]